MGARIGQRGPYIWDKNFNERKNSIASEALDTQPITYNTFSNRELLTQTFVYQRFTHHNFPPGKHPYHLKRPLPR